MRVSVCIICHNRQPELDLLLTSLDGRGWAEILVLDMASSPPIAVPPGVRLLRTETNIGVSAGRNLLASSASGDIFFFLDDDAVLTQGTATELISRFRADPTLAAVACKLVRPSGIVASSEFPFRGSPKSPNIERECAYFVGGATAIRATAFAAVGGYDPHFFYSTEELDLAYRFLTIGWNIRYVPSIVIEHRPSPRGRSSRNEVPALRLRYRIVLARRYLPWPVASVHVSLWGLRTLREALYSGGVRPWLAAWRDGLMTPTWRATLPIRDLLRIHRMGGRVLW